MAEFYRKKKKICQMCAGKSVDYKDVMIINKYINDKGKILPRRMTGAAILRMGLYELKFTDTPEIVDRRAFNHDTI